ncbi:MAG: hypothetical protein E7679_05090 [Ruminococcaceae bacterium]|nr:hypothetical protein [Oscillospiraceae bacterium]
MSSICGIIDFYSERLSFERIHAMGRSMVLRGREQSGAYVERGVALQHNRMVLSSSRSERQPYNIVRGEDSYTVVFDGEIYSLDELSDPIELCGFECCPRAVLEAYLAFGYECVEHMDGAFAFAIYDKTRNEVFVARDRAGLKPLYYMNDGTAFVFASEIKGMLRYMSHSAEIDRAAVAEKIRAPVGSVRGEDIYKEIHELPAGSFALHSKLGTQVSGYRYGASHGKPSWRRESAIICPDTKAACYEPLSLLHEIMIGFDYPCFDEYMPSFLETIKANRGQKRVSIEDMTFAIDPLYSAERADRLGMMNGVMVNTLAPQNEKVFKNNSFYRCEKNLAQEVQRLFSDKNSKVYAMLGSEFLDLIKKEKDVKQRLRSYAMIIQTERWLSTYPVFWV